MTWTWWMTLAVILAVLLLIGLVGCHSLLELINTPEEILAGPARQTYNTLTCFLKWGSLLCLRRSLRSVFFSVCFC